MFASELSLLLNLRTISRYSIFAGVLVSLAFFFSGGFPLQLQVSLAVVSLAVGIPHGAVDHLITVPKLSGLKMALFIAAYLAVVAIAIGFILNQNTLGFQLVVLMSAVHFGVGDAAFVCEIDRRVGKARRFEKILYAFASGFVPVVVPLVNSQSTNALQAVNPKLVGWVGPLAPVILWATVTLAVVAIVVMFASKRLQEGIDLALLLTLAVVAPPLVAFAVYFGLWHALRHTGRLTLELDRSKQMHELGKAGSAFAKAILAGVPALAITLVGAIVLGLSQGFSLAQNLLWYLLVVVWALTVPHMALTARIDARALRKA